MSTLALLADSPESLEAIIKKAVDRALADYKPELTSSSTKKPLNQKEVMEILDISEATLIDWKKRGIIPYAKLGNRCFYDLDKILEAGRAHEKYSHKR